MPALRWGQRMGDGGAVDMMVGALTDPFDTVHMGITAENVAEKWKISREQQDEFAVESHRRAINAIEKGYFKEQILPIEIKTRKGHGRCSTRTSIRAPTRAWKAWPSCARCSRKTARSPPATPPASTTRRRPSC